MINLISEIRGPEFIVLYMAYFTVIFVIMNIYIWYSDTSRNMPSTGSLNDEGIMVLLLKYGNKPGIIVKGIMVNLFSRKLIIINEDGTVVKVKKERTLSLSEHERIVYDYFEEPGTQGAILTDSNIMQRMQAVMNIHLEGLIRMKLIKSPDTVSGEILKIFFFMALFYIPGVIKLYLGIIREKPVGFLVIIIAASLVVFLVKISRLKKAPLTASGKKYLGDLMKKYSSYKSVSANSSPYPDGIQPALYMGLFGVSALMFFPEFGIFESAFSGPVDMSFGCTSCSSINDKSSGSGCSGCSSSDGGGCGGGGCGGCGGD